MDVKQEVKKFEEEIINWRRDLHKIPELGDEVPLTTKYINDVLSQMGLTVKKYSNSGLSTVIEGKNPGPTIAFRADKRRNRLTVCCKKWNDACMRA